MMKNYERGEGDDSGEAMMDIDDEEKNEEYAERTTIEEDKVWVAMRC